MSELPRGVEENLRLLCAELEGQLGSLQSYFEAPNPVTAQRVILRAGYSYNLFNRVQSSGLQALSHKGSRGNRRLLLQNSILVARNMDLIARMARRSLEHAQNVKHQELLRPEAYPSVIASVRKKFPDILPAFAARDSTKAVRIGQVRAALDDLYERLFCTLTRDMRKTKHGEDIAHSLLAANEIHRMGDAMQGISEALLSVAIGQPVQFERYGVLQQLLSKGQMQSGVLELEPLAETRSGSAVSSLRGQAGNGEEFSAVFKDGELQKVREERAGAKSWDSVYPGLAPKILSYKKSGQRAALLIEYLPGETFEHVLLNESDSLLGEAQNALSRTLREVWKRTIQEEPAEMAFMDQLSARLQDVWRVHPELRTGPVRIGGLDLPEFEVLVAQARSREDALTAPFSVHIHGDFNLDNVIYDPAEKQIHFIDLHRSRFMDYVQDVSVFMVSNYRLQIQDPIIRQRVAGIATDFHAMAAKFAKSKKDRYFEYRLALGLARSFATSTRFVLDKAHARRMLERARYLLEIALACPEGKEHRLKLQVRELFSG